MRCACDNFFLCLQTNSIFNLMISFGTLNRLSEQTGQDLFGIPNHFVIQWSFQFCCSMSFHKALLSILDKFSHDSDYFSLFYCNGSINAFILVSSHAFHQEFDPIHQILVGLRSPFQVLFLNSLGSSQSAIGQDKFKDFHRNLKKNSSESSLISFLNITTIRI